MDIFTMQTRPVTDNEIAFHLDNLVSVNGESVLPLVEERARWTAGLGGPVYTENALRLATAARKKMQKG